MAKSCDTSPFSCPCRSCQAFTIRRQVQHASTARRSTARLMTEARS